MNGEHTPEGLRHEEPWLRDQKRKLVDKAVSQLKILFVLPICIYVTYIVTQLIHVASIYADILSFFLLACLIVCDIGLIILFIIDMRRLIRDGIAIYKRKHHLDPEK